MGPPPFPSSRSLIGTVCPNRLGFGILQWRMVGPTGEGRSPSPLDQTRRPWSGWHPPSTARQSSDAPSKGHNHGVCIIHMALSSLPSFFFLQVLCSQFERKLEPHSNTCLHVKRPTECISAFFSLVLCFFLGYFCIVRKSENSPIILTSLSWSRLFAP